MKHRPWIRVRYEIAAQAFERALEPIHQLVDMELPGFERRLEDLGIRWTTGRTVPRWSRGG